MQGLTPLVECHYTVENATTVHYMLLFHLPLLPSDGVYAVQKSPAWTELTPSCRYFIQDAGTVRDSVHRTLP